MSLESLGTLMNESLGRNENLLASAMKDSVQKMKPPELPEGFAFYLYDTDQGPFIEKGDFTEVLTTTKKEEEIVFELDLEVVGPEFNARIMNGYASFSGQCRITRDSAGIFLVSRRLENADIYENTPSLIKIKKNVQVNFTKNVISTSLF